MKDIKIFLANMCDEIRNSKIIGRLINKFEGKMNFKLYEMLVNLTSFDN